MSSAKTTKRTYFIVSLMKCGFGCEFLPWKIPCASKSLIRFYGFWNTHAAISACAKTVKLNQLLLQIGQYLFSIRLMWNWSMKKFHIYKFIRLKWNANEREKKMFDEITVHFHAPFSLTIKTKNYLISMMKTLLAS